MKKIVTLLTVTCFALLAKANIKLPAIIADNMVLQQNTEVALWGWADAGETVVITPGWSKKTVTVKADEKGKWMVNIKTVKAGGPYTISFAGNNSVVVNNVLLGEVWLASGQSNMEFFMNKTSNASYSGVLNYQQEIAAANFPSIRMIDVPNKVSDEPQQNFSGTWKVCSPATADTFSAVAYYFAKGIYEKTGIPVGIINATWGGTPAESWTRKDVLENNAELKPIIDRYKQQCDEYPAAFAKYKIATEAWKADTSKKKGAAPAAPMGPTHNKSPYKLYNGMIAPIIPFTIKGAIWYQGESNADRAWQYRTLFPAMIKNWREDFKNANLPFYFVQISPHRSQNAEIREAQLYTMQTVAHTGMAVTTDNGDSLDIHPRNKKLVGERLLLWALKNEYGEKKLVVNGPLYKSMEVKQDKVELSFSNAKDGLVAKDGSLTEFTIAGADKQFYPAQATIEGNKIIVWSASVPNPVAVRFAWRNIPRPNLYNNAGLPASPFRTDDWQVSTQGKL